LRSRIIPSVQRAEHAQRVIGRCVAQTIQLHEVRLQAIDGNVRLAGFLAHDCQHARRQIDRQTVETALGEGEQQSAGAAAQIDQRSRPREVPLEHVQIEPAQAVFRQRYIIAGGNLLRVSIVPRAARDALGKLPIRFAMQAQACRERERSDNGLLTPHHSPVPPRKQVLRK
jgi:hypothetical protein